MPANAATPSQTAQPARRVLVVDDTAICREPLLSALKLKGFDAIGAQDGQKALDLIRSARPDLLLLDIMMPQMDGWTLLRILRADPKYAALPVILLTATADRQLIARARTLGVREYLLKGQFSIKELFARIEKCLDLPAENVAVVSPTPPSTDAAMTAVELEEQILAQATVSAQSLQASVGELVAALKRHPHLAGKVIQAADAAISPGEEPTGTNLDQVVRSVALKAVRNIATCAG